MKGITMCADCAYYNIKTHKCTRGCTVEPDIENGDDVRFFTDCPLPNVAEVRHGEGCEYCKGRSYTKKPLTVTTRTMKRVEGCFNYCPNCGRDMRATGTNVGAKEVLTMAEPKLRNCPFCGGEPEAYGYKGFSLETGKEAWRYYIVCTGCTALVSGETEAEAAEYWNRRDDNG